MQLKTAWIGLGRMGFPMAGHLQRKSGAELIVYNRTMDRAKEWAAIHKSNIAPTARDAALSADFVFACVGNDEDLRAVTVGEYGAFHGMKPGAIFVDHTTASADVARQLHAEAKMRGFGFVDAPISGGQPGAENATLSVTCGGDEADYEKAEPLIMNYAQICKRMGPAGSGQLAKMCHQIAIAGIVQGLAESMHFGINAGLDMERVVEVISKGAAGSWQMDNRHKTMIAGQYDFGFAVDWMRKDLGICLAEARRNQSHLPITALIDQFYSEIQKIGGGRNDTSSLMARLMR